MSGAVALVAEHRDMSIWVIGFDICLFTAVYSVIKSGELSINHQRRIIFRN
jgi:hypothetical protein